MTIFLLNHVIFGASWQAHYRFYKQIFVEVRTTSGREPPRPSSTATLSLRQNAIVQHPKWKQIFDQQTTSLFNTIFVLQRVSIGLS